MRLQDADFVHRQLHAVMAERDSLQDAVRQLRTANMSGAPTPHTLPFLPTSLPLCLLSSVSSGWETNHWAKVSSRWAEC